MTATRAERRRIWRAGRLAETLAAWRLRLAGYRIVARGVRGTRGSGVGEIDIVARRGGVLAFVEVKARPDPARGAEALRPAQCRRIERAARCFVGARPDLAGLGWRFDLIVVAGGLWPRHLPDAWRPGRDS